MKDLLVDPLFVVVKGFFVVAFYQPFYHPELLKLNVTIVLLDALGWVNCDIFGNMPYTTVVVPLTPATTSHASDAAHPH